MKSLMQFLLLHFAFLCVYQTTKGQAKIAGGEIIYKHSEDSTYWVYCIAYFDCASGAEPSTMPFCVTTTCNTAYWSFTFNKLSSEDALTTCAAYPNTCTVPSSTIQGYKKCVYAYKITLPFQCNHWIFSTYYATRTLPANFAATNAYFETKFNNVGSFQGNSSPEFSNPAVAYQCYQSPTTHHNGDIDINKDSLSTDIIVPRTHTTCGTTASYVTFNTSFPKLTTPNNPFQTNNTLIFNAVSGHISFTPHSLGSNIITTKTDEYRKGVWVGSVARDICFNTLTCNTVLPTLSNPFSLASCSLAPNKSIQACAGQAFSFDVDIKSSDTSAILIATDNHTMSIVGALITYTNQGADSLRMHFSLPALYVLPGQYNLSITVKDSTCKPPGILIRYNYTIPIYISAKPNAGKDTSVCYGQPVTLQGSSSGYATWSMLPGGNSTIAPCLACPNPTATPKATTTFVYTNSFCPNMTDTMTIFVTPIKVPSISISANPSTYITQGTSVTFTATPVNCINPLFRWRINFNSTPVGTGITYTSTAINTGDKIVCDMICNDSCASPKGPQSNILAMYVWPANVNQLNSINLISIYPNPNNGSFTLDGKTSNNDPVKLAIINSIGQTLYHDIIKPENHELNTQLNVQLPQGIYILKLDNQTIRFTVSY